MATEFFRVPYTRDVSDYAPYVRRCAMDNHTADIVAAGGAWEEIEINLAESIVRVQARNNVLRGLPFPVLSETEARSLWSPTRAVPKYDAQTDSLVVDQTRTAPTKTIDEVVSRITDAKGSAELSALVALWSGLGFGLGWRLPGWLAVQLAQYGEPGAGWKATLLDHVERHGLWERIYDLLQVVLISTGGVGAFPTTSVLDNFNRADENPLGNSQWGGEWYPGLGEMRLVSNAATNQSSGAFDSSYYSASTFGEDTEVFVTVTTEALSTKDQIIALRSRDNGLSTLDAYDISIVNATGTDTWKYRRLDNASVTTLGSTVNLELANGEKIGYEAIGSALKAYHFTGGSWSAIDGGRTDSTYDIVANIAMGTYDGVMDDFGGGTVVVGGTTKRYTLPLLGVG